jgi:hypothetical protein
MIARSGESTDRVLTERRVLCLVLILAAVLRLGLAAILPDQSAKFPDIVGYRNAALELMAGHRISSDLGMPGYVVLLVATGVTTIGRILADVTFSVLSVWCVARITREISADPWSGTVAGLLWAIYPFSIFYAVVGSTETLFTTLLLLGFLAYYRGRFGLGSLAMAGAILTRPHIVILAPILVLVFSQLMRNGARSDAKTAALGQTMRVRIGRSVRNLAVFAACLVVLMTPWWWHNYEKYRTFVPLNLGGGIVLYSGNNPMNRTGGGIGGVDYDPDAFSEITDPVDRNRALSAAAIRYILENPLRFAELAVLKFARLWRPWPYAKEYSSLAIAVISAASFLPVLLFAIAGAVAGWRRQGIAVVPIFLFIAYTTAVHMVTIASLRYRFPMEPFLVILAAPMIAVAARRLLETVRAFRTIPAQP